MDEPFDFNTLYGLLGSFAVIACIFGISRWLVPYVRCWVTEMNEEWLEFRELNHKVNRQGGLEDKIALNEARIETIASRALDIKVEKLDASSNKTEVAGNLDGDFIQGNQTKVEK